MQEDFLHFIWRYQYFDHTDLFTTSGESIQIIQPGIPHQNSGPDFESAKVHFGSMEWVGNVEIHINSSHWYQHNHHNDPAYNNVILHVVWKDDRPAITKDQNTVPTLELSKRIDHQWLIKYKRFNESAEELPCGASLANVTRLKFYEMIDKAVSKRLFTKSDDIDKLYHSTNFNWEEAAYCALAKNFGFNVNSEPFLQLAKNLPFKVIKKHANNLRQIEALLFGQAGFLSDEPVDEYQHALKQEYDFLAHKYNLQENEMNRFQWRFLRLRPANFPTIRIAQFAVLLSGKSNLFSELVTNQETSQIVKGFKITQSPYWQKNFDFGKPFSSEMKGLGISSIENIAINTIAPLLTAFGKHKDDQQLVDKATSLLESVKAERNKITRLWSDYGIEVKTAFDSQGLIGQYNTMCKARKCITCSVGIHLMSQEG